MESDEIFDKVNKKIIEILKSDGRASYSKIADNLKVSESTIRKRINKLIKDQIIERFTVILNPEKDNKYVLSFLTIIPTQSDLSIKELAKTVIDFPEVIEAHYLSGKCGFLVKVVVQNLGQLDELISKVRNLPGISEIESCIVLRELKRNLS